MIQPPSNVSLLMTRHRFTNLACHRSNSQSRAPKSRPKKNLTKSKAKIFPTVLMAYRGMMNFFQKVNKETFSLEIIRQKSITITQLLIQSLFTGFSPKIQQKLRHTLQICRHVTFSCSVD